MLSRGTVRRGALRAALALSALSVGGCSTAADAPESCDLPHVAAEHCEAAHALQIPAELPPARGNKYADDEQAARLGLSLFFDPNLGRGVSCATCHLPELSFADRRPVSTGKGLGNRNSPTTFNAARLSVFFWDGRADSLWSQPLIPIESPVEMASTRLEVAQRIVLDYQPRYEAVFGALPDVSSWPAAGKPGDPAFDELPGETRTDVNRVFSNVGKALEAFMRKSISARAELDAFLDGDHDALLEPAQRGLAVFFRGGCGTCHGGPMLTDEAFHDVGFPSLPDAAPDRGRADGVSSLLSNEFNLAGPYADRAEGEPSPVMPVAREEDVGAFRTPSLRNVAQTFPYGHDGALRSLPEVLDVHASDLSSDDRNDLLAFLQTLSGAHPAPPWNDWPSRQ